MIEIVFKPNIYELEITGHAGADVKGKDIVCAAVSSLFYTLGQAVIESESMLMEAPVFEDEDGHGLIRCVPKAKYEGNISRSYWTILVGLQMLAEQYPSNISFKAEALNESKIEG